MVGILIGVLLACWMTYLWWTRYYNYWQKRGFPSLEASFPLGSSRGLSLMVGFQGTAAQEVCRKLASHPYGGIVILRRPYLVVKDPDIVKHVLIKDFEYFRDRITKDNVKEPVSNHLFNLGGDHWRVKRVNLGPVFSTTKMRNFFPTFDRVAEDLQQVLDASQGSPVNAKMLFSQFTIDFIGSWAFGIEVKTLKDPTSPFLTMGLQMFPPMTQDVRLKLSSFNVLPGLEDQPWLARFGYIPPQLGEFVEAVSKQIMTQREAQPRPGLSDFVDFLLKLKSKGSIVSDKTSPDSKVKLDMTDSELAAEQLIFYTAGYDTTSSTVSHALYELAMGPPAVIQRAQQELDSVVGKHGSITYQALTEMPYLDMIVKETLRKYPVVPILTRICMKDYEMPDKPLVVEKGTRVLIPVWAIQRDPELFPDPDTFRPERFASGVPRPCTYFPFGEGPRYCIGKRIGLIQVKAGLAHTLLRYDVGLTNDTPSELEFCSTMLVTTLTKPLNLTFRRRPATKL